MRVVVILCLLAGLAQAESRTATGYRHGRAFRLRVVDIDLSEVEVSTARAFRTMERAAAKDGVALIVMSGFRTYAKQAELYRDWRAGEGHLAARPGYSNHQSGRALDIVLARGVLDWLSGHAPRFGFRRTVPGESWHWEFVGAPHGKRVARRR